MNQIKTQGKKNTPEEENMIQAFDKILEYIEKISLQNKGFPALSEIIIFISLIMEHLTGLYGTTNSIFEIEKNNSSSRKTEISDSLMNVILDMAGRKITEENDEVKPSDLN